VAHRKGRTDEEFLIRRGAARMIRAHEIPRELEQLHPVGSGELAGGPEGLEQLAQLGILQHVYAGRELKLTAAHELAHDVDQLRVVLYGPVDGGIHVTPVEQDEAGVAR